MPKLRTFVAFGAGLAAAYFLDPKQGAQRRAEALRRIQGDVAPQAKAKAQDKITSLQEAGGELVRRAAPRKRPDAAGDEPAGLGEAGATPSPAPGAPPPITEG